MMFVMLSWMRCTFVLLFLSLSFLSFAEKVELVANINQTLVDTWAGKHLTSYQNKLYFTADGGALGEELYVYDPKTGDITLIMDINIGEEDSKISDLLVFDNKLYFFAFDGTQHGLYQYDQLSKLEFLDKFDGLPSDLTVYKEELYFALRQQREYVVTGQLYKYDKDAGKSVKKFGTGSDLNGNAQLVVVEDKLYMILPWDYYGGIFVYDKETDKTEHLDYVAESKFSAVMGFNPFYALFSSNDKLYVHFSSGVAMYDPSTNLISNATPSLNIENSARVVNIFNNKVIFSSGYYDEGKLFSYNLLNNETQLIFDIYCEPSSKVEFIVYNEKLFFSADDGIHGKELFVYDDVTGEVTLAVDVLLGAPGSYPTDFTVFNDELYFSALNHDGIKQIYKYNEDTATLTSIFELTSGYTKSSFPSLFIEYNEQLYFAAFDGTDTNKTFAYDTLTEDLTPISAYSLLNYATVYQDKLYFISQDKELGEGFFAFDSETQVASLIDNIEIIGKPNALKPMVGCSNKLYFMTWKYTAYSNISVTRLYAYDPVSNSLELVTDKLLNWAIHFGDDEFNMEEKMEAWSELTVYQNKLYFNAYLSDETSPYGIGEELYAYDCEREELFIVADIDTVDNSEPYREGSYIKGMFVDKGKLFFTAKDDVNGRQFYSYDGNTKQLTAFEKGPIYNYSKKPLIVQGKWYFSTIIDNRPALEIYDATSYQSTVILLDNVSRLEDNRQLEVFKLTAYNNKVYFKAQRLSDGITQMYVYDIASETISNVFDDDTGVAVDNLDSTSDMKVYKNKLYFSGLFENHGYELFSLHTNHLPEGSIDITGSAIEHQTITANNNFSDTDGEGDISYQWYSNNIAIDGATSNNYAITSGDVGKSITVVGSYYDGEGAFEQVTSQPVNIIRAGSLQEETQKSSSGGTFDAFFLLLILACLLNQRSLLKTQGSYLNTFRYDQN
jgi:ELWxxDGT repeat protein